MPKFIDQIGEGLDPESTEHRFLKEIASGLIGHFSAFQNIFKPSAYDSSAEKNEKLNLQKTNKKLEDLALQKHACYPPKNKDGANKLEFELENFAKQVVSTLNLVV